MNAAPQKNMNPEDSGTALSQIITINGQDFDVNEVQDLMGVGRQTRELEQKYNTKLDRVWPDYGQKSQQLSELTKERDALKQQIESFQTKKEDGTETAADLAQAKEAARKLGIVLNEDLEKGAYLKKDDLERFLEERDQKSKAVEAVVSRANDLEKQIDGSDGRPPFKQKAIMAYAAAYKLSLEDAYEQMHEDELKSWKEAKLAQEKKKGLSTLRPGGTKTPTNPGVNRDNLRASLEEAINSAE